MEQNIIHTIELLKRIHINIISNSQKDKQLFKSNLLFQVTELLHRKIISLSESIILLNRNYKYSESRMVLRNLFETGIFILYLQQKPSEANRWANWNNLSFEDKDKIPKKFDDFNNFLSNNKYVDALNLLNKKNVNSIRNFSPSFIRNVAFENHPNLNGDYFKEFYNLICKFAHPSFVSLGENDILKINSKEDIEKSTSFILFESSYIFIEILYQFIDNEFKELFNNIYKINYNKLFSK